MRFERKIEQRKIKKKENLFEILHKQQEHLIKKKLLSIQKIIKKRCEIT